MNTHDHQALVRLGMSALRAAGERDVDALEAGCLDTCMYPDQFAIRLLEGKSGPWRKYFPAERLKFNFQQDMRDLHGLMPKNRFYIRQALRHLRAGDVSEAARFLGVYSHYVGDFAQPAHYYELHIANLLPPPAHYRNCNYHRMLEDVCSTVTTPRRRARLLALSPPDLEFRLTAPYGALHARAMAAVVPMLRSVYRRNHPHAVRALNPVVQAAGELFGDACLTILRIARGDFTPREASALRCCPLHTLPPNAFDAEFNFSQRPLVNWITRETYGRAERFRLRYAPDDIRTVDGVCVIPHALPGEGISLSSMMEYHLPRGVFGRFEADVGLLAGVDRQAKCRFEVELDGRAAFQSPWAGPGDPAGHVVLDVEGVRRLRLLTPTDGSTDRLAFPIWASPRLFR